MEHPFPLDDDVRIVATETKLSGSTDRLDRDFRYRERLVLVIDVTAGSVELKPGKSGPTLKRTLDITDVYELAGERGREVINALRAERRQTDREAEGAPPIPGLEDLEVTTDGSGVVATPSELDAMAAAGAAETIAEPWEGFDTETVAQVKEALEKTKAISAGPGFTGLVERTLAYEEAHGARVGLVAYCRKALGETPAPGEVPPLPGEGDDDPEGEE